MFRAMRYVCSWSFSTARIPPSASFLIAAGQVPGDRYLKLVSGAGQPDWILSAARWDRENKLHLYGARTDLVQLEERSGGYCVAPLASRSEGMLALERFLPSSSA